MVGNLTARQKEVINVNATGRFYSLRNFFDVWKDEEDGWAVNNSCIEFEDLYISDDASEKEILQYLVDRGFLKTTDRRIVRLDEASYADAIEIYEVKGHKPIGMLTANT